MFGGLWPPSQGLAVFIWGDTPQTPHVALCSVAFAHLSPGITWNGWVVPIWLSLAIVGVMGLGMLGVAIVEFSRTE